MLKNTATKIWVYCYDSTTNLPKTGDAANLTGYYSLDFGTRTVLTDTSATEHDSTNAKGWYWFDVAQAETNGDVVSYSCKSSTSNVVCLAVPAVHYTIPTTGLLAPATAGRTLVVDAAGLADANVVKAGASGSGVAWNSGAIQDTTFATDAITSSKLKTNAIDKIAAGVWRDAVAADFTQAGSVGLSVMNGVALGTGLTIASVSGAVGSVTGNVGGSVASVAGNVLGSVAAVATGGIVAASFATNAITAAASSLAPMPWPKSKAASRR